MQCAGRPLFPPAAVQPRGLTIFTQALGFLDHASQVAEVGGRLISSMVLCEASHPTSPSSHSIGRGPVS